jgi:hypothetical protein
MGNRGLSPIILLGAGAVEGCHAGLICAQAGAFDERFIDRPSQVHTVQDVGILHVSPAAVTNWMNEFAGVTNSNLVPYLYGTYNSNSYAFTFVESLGYTRPTPFVEGALGWSAGKPSSNLSYWP